MKYQLDPNCSLRVAVGDAARAQLDAALNRARRGDGAAAVHALRTHCKKLRALLRLVRDGMPDCFREENAAFRDAARLLAPLRDESVVLRTHDALLSSFGGAIAVPAARDVRERLELRLAGADAPALAEQIEALLAEVAARLEAARDRIARWHLHGSDARIIYCGMKRTYRRARRTRAAALGSADSARFHEWRKRVKYHWYHLRLVSALCAGRLDERERQMDRLGKLLGEAHDLAVYEHYLHEVGGPSSPAADCAVLSALSAYRRAELQQRAIEQSAGLFAGKPAAIVAALVA